MNAKPFRRIPPDKSGGREADDTAVDIPPIRATTSGRWSELHQAVEHQDVGEVVVPQLPADHGRPAAASSEPTPDAAAVGQLPSPYQGRPTRLLGQNVWCWYGPLTGRWWGLVKWESRRDGLRLNLLIEAPDEKQLHAKICPMLTPAIKGPVS